MKEKYLKYAEIMERATSMGLITKDEKLVV